MAKVIFDNLSLDYPIYDSVSRSFTRSLTNSIPVGGRIRRKGAKQRPTISALDSVNVSIKEGDRVALIGHNGAGKTSMLKVIAGFFEPTCGQLVREGRVAALLNLRAGMDLNLTGFDNILLCGMLHGLSRADILKRVDSIAEFSELGSYLDLPVRLYSSGMMQRLAFSICTSIDCDILLLDEWIGAGDQSFISNAKRRLSSVISQSSIMVFATHNPKAAQQLCNRAFYLDHGKLIMQGSVDEVLAFSEKQALTV